MNKRIRQLAKQAGMNYDSYDRYGYFNEEKFAELFVQECAYILATYRLQFDDGFEYNGVHPIQAIYKHFGLVEIEE